MKNGERNLRRIRRFFTKIILLSLVLAFLFKLVHLFDDDIQAFFVTRKQDEYASEYIYLVNRKTGEIAYEKNARKKAYPASLTKMMTTLVALEHIEDLSTTAPIDVESYQQMVAQNAAMAGFVGREQVTYRDLLYGTILSSGGEAANSLAINVAGNLADFTEMMNEKANEMGLEDTHFTNVEGMHDAKQFTTAQDMAKLLDYALDNGHFKAVFTKKSFQTSPTLDHPEGIYLTSTVLSQLNENQQNGFEIIGGKSGTTYQAGQCWATLGTIDDEEYICIVMGAELSDLSNPNRAQIADTLALFENLK